MVDRQTRARRTVRPWTAAGVLPSFSGMLRAPSVARLQTHVHAASRTPRLHRQLVMTAPQQEEVEAALKGGRREGLSVRVAEGGGDGRASAR